MTTHSEKLQKFLIIPFPTKEISSFQTKKMMNDEKCENINKEWMLKFTKIRDDVKNSISKIDLIEDKNKVRKLFKAFDYFLFLKKDISNYFNAQVVTNAWLKCYELLNYFDIISLLTNNAKDQKINAFFNAELPGAFISATNHYIKTMFPTIAFNWVASSLYGTDHNLSDSYGLYKNNPNKWLMAAKSIAHNGDLTDPNVLLKIQKQIHEIFPDGLNLYTSDGGIDVDEDYIKQEEINAKLNFGQVLCGLLTLSEGGISITKQYMFTYANTISLLVIMSYCFRELYIVKPMTSRPVNSEVYIIGIGFYANKITKKFQEYLLGKLRNFDFAQPLISFSCVANETMESIYDAAKNIHGNNQIISVNKVIDAYFNNSMDKIYTNTKHNYKYAISSYFKNYPVKKIQDKDKLNTA